MRNQVRLVMQYLDAMLAEDHQARVVWAFVEGLDLSAFYASIQAVRGGPGRPASQRSPGAAGALGVSHGGRCGQRSEPGSAVPGSRFRSGLPLAERGCTVDYQRASLLRPWPGRFSFRPPDSRWSLR